MVTPIIALAGDAMPSKKEEQIKKMIILRQRGDIFGYCVSSFSTNPQGFAFYDSISLRKQQYHFN
jgi:hypothetical protein